MSVLHEMGYYDEGELDDEPTEKRREDGELTPSPSDEDEPEVLTEKHAFPIGSGRLVPEALMKKSFPRHRKFVSRKESLSILKETELRLRILALTALRNRNSLE